MAAQVVVLPIQRLLHVRRQHRFIAVVVITLTALVRDVRSDKSKRERGRATHLLSHWLPLRAATASGGALGKRKSGTWAGLICRHPTNFHFAASEDGCAGEICSVRAIQCAVATPRLARFDLRRIRLGSCA